MRQSKEVRTEDLSRYYVFPNQTDQNYKGVFSREKRSCLGRHRLRRAPETCELTSYTTLLLFQ